MNQGSIFWFQLAEKGEQAPSGRENCMACHLQKKGMERPSNLIIWLSNKTSTEGCKNIVEKSKGVLISFKRVGHAIEEHYCPKKS